MRVFGAATPYEYLRESKKYASRSISRLVKADVLLMAGTDDHYVPLRQIFRQARVLTNARSVTARIFTRDERAHNHIQVGNIGLSLKVIGEWLDGIEQKEAP